MVFLEVAEAGEGAGAEGGDGASSAAVSARASSPAACASWDAVMRPRRLAEGGGAAVAAGGPGCGGGGVAGGEELGAVGAEDAVVAELAGGGQDDIFADMRLAGWSGRRPVSSSRGAAGDVVAAGGVAGGLGLGGFPGGAGGPGRPCRGRGGGGARRRTRPGRPMFHLPMACSRSPFHAASLICSRYHSATDCLTRRMRTAVEFIPSTLIGSSAANNRTPWSASSRSSRGPTFRCSRR